MVSFHHLRVTSRQALQRVGSVRGQQRVLSLAVRVRRVQHARSRALPRQRLREFCRANHRVETRVPKIRDADSIAGFFTRRCGAAHDPVRRGEVIASRAQLYHLAEVDNDGVWLGRRVDPLAGAVFYLQTADVVLEEETEVAAVGVRPHAERADAVDGVRTGVLDVRCGRVPRDLHLDVGFVLSEPIAGRVEAQRQQLHQPLRQRRHLVQKRRHRGSKSGALGFRGPLIGADQASMGRDGRIRQRGGVGRGGVYAKLHLFSHVGSSRGVLRAQTDVSAERWRRAVIHGGLEFIGEGEEPSGGVQDALEGRASHARVRVRVGEVQVEEAHHVARLAERLAEGRLLLRGAPARGKAEHGELGEGDGRRGSGGRGGGVGDGHVARQHRGIRWKAHRRASAHGRVGGTFGDDARARSRAGRRVRARRERRRAQREPGGGHPRSVASLVPLTTAREAIRFHSQPFIRPRPPWLPAWRADFKSSRAATVRALLLSSLRTAGVRPRPRYVC